MPTKGFSVSCTKWPWPACALLNFWLFTASCCQRIGFASSFVFSCLAAVPGSSAVFHQGLRHGNHTGTYGDTLASTSTRLLCRKDVRVAGPMVILVGPAGSRCEALMSAGLAGALYLESVAAILASCWRIVLCARLPCFIHKAHLYAF